MSILGAHSVYDAKNCDIDVSKMPFCYNHYKALSEQNTLDTEQKELHKPLFYDV